LTLRLEEIDVRSLLGNLEGLGWINGSKIVGVEERELAPLFFEDILKSAIKKINSEIFSSLTSEEEEQVLREVFDRLNVDDEVRILQYLKYGVEVYLKKRQRKVVVKLIDYERANNNLFFYLVRPRFRGSPQNIEPDIVLYINGIPIVVIEVKQYIKPQSYLEALNQIRRYEMYSPDVFRFIQFGIAFGDEQRYTPTWPNWSRENRDVPAYRWIVKEIGKDKQKREYEDVTYILEPHRLLEYIRYFIFYRRERDGSLGKIIARYNQYYATKKAVKRLDEYMNGSELNRGLIWHWLGSGKTYTMFFIANYFLDKYWDRRPIVFFIVDRSDLEEQHIRMLSSIEEPKFRRLFKKIESIEELHERIRVIKESEYLGGVIAYGVYLTTIQKFQRGRRLPETKEDVEKEIEEFRGGLLDLLIGLGQKYLEWLKKEKPDEYQRHAEKLSKLKGKDREEYLVKLGQISSRNILLLIDEAHRSQYGILAAMMKTVFPNAIAFGFTGTPIFKHERNTFLEFAYPDRGELYLDVYFIRDSIRDGFTLPLVYQAISEGEVSKEGVRIKLTEEEIKKFIEEYMKAREEGIDIADRLDPSLYKKVSEYINKIRIFLMNENRIDKLAKYIVERVEEDTEGFKFKAMVVAVNRVACVRFKRSLEKYLVEKYGDRAREWVEVVMTYNYNDTDPEIVSYREELVRRFGTSDMNEINHEIQRRFLEREDPRILIVTDMLITGFDAPMLKVMYLDKPLYEHRLLQAIARVNRPYPGKEFGLIVDSLGLIEHLSKTLALYDMLADEEARRDLEENLLEGIEHRVEEFELLLENIKRTLSSLRLGDQDVSIDLEDLKRRLKEKDFDRMDFESRIGIIALYASSNEVNNDVVKAKRLVNDISRVIRLYRALGSHPKKIFYVEDVEVLAFIYGMILKKMYRGRFIGSAFWRELVKFIHSRTLVEEFNKIDEIKIDADIDTLLKTSTPSINALRKVVADFYFYLRSILAENIHDPIYRRIMERLNRLLREWITRKIDLKTFLSQLRSLKEEVEEYEKRIKGKAISDKIIESINIYINSEVLKSRKDKAITLKLSSTKNEIEKLLRKKSPSIKSSDKRRLARALLNDLFTELGGIVDEREVAKMVDNLVDEFIVEELERALRKDEERRNQ